MGVEPPPGVAVLEMTGVSGLGPPRSVLALAAWGAWRWAIPMATLLRTASPERNVWALPTPPPPERPPRRAGAISVTGPGWGAVLGRRGAGTVLVREGPARDLLPIVLDVVDHATGPVLVLAPATGWAARLAERLRRRGLSVAGTWAEAAAGWPVVVGSRAAAWAPIERLGAAVVLDVHDYKDRYDAAEVVAERCARDGAPCVLVSPCPTAVQVDRYGPPVVPARSEERGAWPAVTVVDRRGADPRTGLYSEELVRLARSVLPERLVCVLNRTGRARLLACAACGELARCTTCGRPLEDDGGTLRCPGCGATRPIVCAACDATKFKVLRRGVARVREELEALLGTAVGEVSGPSRDDPVPDAAVLVGTEAVLHRVRRAAAVAFLDFDQHLLAPRFTAAEQALGLLALAGRLVGGRAGGRAGAAGGRGSGRRAGSGTVLVQTRLPDHAVLRAAVAGDPSLATELDVRRALGLPPASALAVVRADRPPTLGDGVEVSSLGGGRWLVRAPDHKVLCDAVAILHGGVRVDPDDV